MGVLAGAGLALQPVKGHGPDILIHTPDGARCWIEAVAATPGEEKKEDTVWQRPATHVGSFSGPSDEKVMLRYLSVIKDKREKILKYRKRGIVKEGDACLIALSHGGIIDSDLCDEEVPAVVRAVLGIGEPVLHLPIYSDEPSYVETPPRDAVLKTNGSRISTRGFLDGAVNGVAGILWVSQKVWNLRWEASKSLKLVHNPTAAVPIKVGSIPTRCEMWVEDGWLKHQGCCASFGPYA
jgi:hypothetical protein